MKTLNLLLLLCLILTKVNAQNYRYGEMVIQKPEQIMVNNFTGMPLPVEDGTMNANRFNPQNPYTYIQMIYNEQNNLSQLLIQTDFYGRIVYVGFSNNLLMAFDKKNNSINIFTLCLRQVNTEFGTIGKMQHLLKCVLDQINHFGAS